MDSQVTYTNHRGVTEERTIRVRRVFYGATEWHPQLQWLVDAWDMDRQAMRTFALSGFAIDSRLVLTPELLAEALALEHLAAAPADPVAGLLLAAGAVHHPVSQSWQAADGRWVPSVLVLEAYQGDEAGLRAWLAVAPA